MARDIFLQLTFFCLYKCIRTSVKVERLGCYFGCLSIVCGVMKFSNCTVTSETMECERHFAGSQPGN